MSIFLLYVGNILFIGVKMIFHSLYLHISSTETTVMSCCMAKRIISGRRAIVPSSFVSSQRTAVSPRPASFTRSTLPSVCPLLSKTPFSLACKGNTWPGWDKSSGFASRAIAVFIVCILSTAETPVVTPSLASIEIVKAVWFLLEFSSTI